MEKCFNFISSEAFSLSLSGMLYLMALSSGQRAAQRQLMAVSVQDIDKPTAN